MRKTAWIGIMTIIGMVGIANAEVIYVDFNDVAGALLSSETYNVLTTTAGNGQSHPVATAGGGLSMTNLVDTHNVATGVGITLHSYSAHRTAAGSEGASGASVDGIDTNALDGFWLNDQGQGAIDFGFIVTFTKFDRRRVQY